MRWSYLVLQGAGASGFIVEILGNFMNYRFVIIFSTFLTCLLLAVVVNVIYGIDIVYTHLFYIPIILTGIWYPRYAGFCAASLGLIHIACDYATIEAFKITSLLRGVMFMVVAYVTSYLALRRDRLLNSLRESEEALKQSHDKLEQHVAGRTEELIRVNEELQTDITDRKKAEEALRESEGRSRGLAGEMAVIAEIGRLISSTLDINEVYERFAAETQKLMLFDSLTVNLCNVQENTMCVAYVSGLDIDGRRQGDPLVLEGSLSEAVIRSRTSLRIQPANIDEIAGRFPRLSPIFQVGLRSIMCVPLISRNEVIGVLHFRAKRSNAYTEEDIRLAERIGAQIAGAIANAQLYAGLKKTEQELKDSEQRYRDLSIIDDLTQLYNSRHFYFQLKIELDRSNRYEQPLTLLLLDLDNFKTFNDAYGHVEGDQVLMRLGHAVKRCLRETDFAYRYGGEEFTILLPMTTSADGAVTAERIRTEFTKETFSPAPGQDVHVTVSIGLAQYKPKEEMKAFVHRVDQLMYQGKKNGKDRVCCEPSLQEQFKGQSSLHF
jgi:diguanylate cyclase (GGDEF)-like protein